ncbi:YgiT-type zinc finger protein [Phototrophicus methaneseepsis]|uniref:YgiT-type zinc finger protein n=1 Tax=Phototrophicus methaneseepsis TaxID=2710758 RepID=A0A7S8E7E5_9CHLR|nr:YgiT-type zinc finger protein [Phototrophicus methaneseepsis]
MTSPTQHKKQDWCPNCQIGQRRVRPVTLVAKVQGQLFQLPDVSLYSCDICGYEEITAEAGELIDYLSSIDGSVSSESTSGNEITQISPRSTFRRKDASAK